MVVHGNAKGQKMLIAIEVLGILVIVALMLWLRQRKGWFSPRVTTTHTPVVLILGLVSNFISSTLSLEALFVVGLYELVREWHFHTTNKTFPSKSPHPDL
jgi:hypothetical protein